MCRWQTEFENNQVLVMTAQIFVDILNHGYQSVSRINLLIFDECHAATKDAPMKQVLRKLDQCESKIVHCKFSQDIICDLDICATIFSSI